MKKNYDTTKKAKELLSRFREEIYRGILTPANVDIKREQARNEKAKQCVLIAVEECLKMLEGLHKPEYVSFDIYEPKQYHKDDDSFFTGYDMQDFWQKVKEEIEKL